MGINCKKLRKLIHRQVTNKKLNETKKRMIKNFDKIKQQLQELAPIINSFKSENVQLRVIELVLQGESEGFVSAEDFNDKPEIEQKPKRKRKTKTKTNSDLETSDSKSPQRGATGAHAVISGLFDEGFFKNPQTIRLITNHLSTNKGRHFKSNQISPSLLRLLREEKLTRSKNDENQYEYREA